MSEGALSGLLVVAIEQAVAAPLCTVRLADAGARVIKIERAGGETARHYDAVVKGTSAYFAWLNRGKQSAVLDLKADADLAVLFAMLKRADVLVQNLIPGALARMGLAPDVIAGRFPRLIAVSINGYGQDTAYARMRAYDMLVQAESGLCAVTGTPETPSKIGVSAADIATGMNAHAAILEALIERGMTGRGKQIEIAMFDGVADWMAVPLLHYEHGGRETGRYGLSHASIYPYRPFACKDGAVIIAAQTNGEWKRLCDIVLHRPDLAAHPDFVSNAARVANRAALDRELDPVFAQLTTGEVITLLDAAGVAWGRYTDVRDLGAHPALRRMDITLADGQQVSIPRPAGRGPGFRPGPVPGTGADTASLRAEFGPSHKPT
ncbi:CoA transferase [Frigidibacter albus]|uniref:CoA transferase n=1 Tax=Frigidibacter albus TaxID=1465486 RepID=A0A6L8VGM5_9RHOB|nr:CaiB/BaiF CoA-transferase family protein [Frigidibacter albus]MZQ89304.1 CoA transferase [Frigidibacter albus]NBE31210.1 CoA transferase [Frigidibacter albus]GGH53497.1 CoA transferase [Frigidibacter albus]